MLQNTSDGCFCIFTVSLEFGAYLHHRSVGRVQSKECYLMGYFVLRAHIVFRRFFVVFCFVFLSFSFLLLGYTDTNFKVTNLNVSQILLVNNSRIPTNAKFPGYYFHRNTNIWGYFQICISVHLMKY